MKKLLLLIAVLAIGTVAIVYKKSETHSQSQQAVRSHMDYNYPYDKRDVFYDDASADLAEMDQNIKQLSEKTVAASAAVKADAQATIQKLSDKRTALGKKLDTLKSASETNWNDLKTDYQKFDQDMKSSLQEAWQRLTQKMPA